MEIFCKKNTELSYQELEVLFQLYKYNNKTTLHNNIKSVTDRIKKIETEEYKDKWIRAILDNNLLLCFECVESNNLIGFALLTLNENENYINEMHIIEQRQQDGITFRSLVNSIFQKAQVDKDFTGRIWRDNYNAKRIFKSMGAIPIEDKYRISYKKLEEWIKQVPSSGKLDTTWKKSDKNN